MNAIIATLLEKYWEGETSIAEERQLRSYFASGDVAPEFAAVAPLFQAIAAEQKVEMPAAPVRAMAPNRWRMYAAAAALTGLMAVGGWLAYQQQAEMTMAATATSTDTYEDPEQAVAEIKAALALVSSKLNKGTETAAKGLHHVETVQRFIKIPADASASPSQF